LIQLIAAVLISLPGAMYAADAVIVGDVDSESQLITSDGEIYVLADTEKGRELSSDYVGETVEVKGSVAYEEEDDLKIITVASFKVVVPDGLEEGDGE
jgi:hypothetical protein